MRSLPRFILTWCKALDNKCLNRNLTSVEDLKLLKKRTLGPASLQNIKRFVYSLVYKHFLEFVNVYVIFLKAKHQKVHLSLFTYTFLSLSMFTTTFSKHEKKFHCSLSLYLVCQCSLLLSQICKTWMDLSLTLHFYFPKPKGLSFSRNSDIP